MTPMFSTNAGPLSVSFRLFTRLCFIWLCVAILGWSAQAALIGYWKFDEGAGTLAADTSGVGTPHNGTLAVGGTGALPTWIPGRFGTGLDFNRVNNDNGSRVTVPNQADLLLNNAFTVSFWYRPGPNIGTFPGPMRIGSQSSTGSDVGWGFFRNQSGNRIVYKRGNAQPGTLYPTTLVNGQWYHVVLRHDGGTANAAYIFGLSTNTTTAQSWLDGNSVNIFEFGRMDQFDDCDLDDVALFDEALPIERIYTLNSVPVNLGLDYAMGDVRALWTIFDGGPGSSGTVKGVNWTYTTTLPGSTTPGAAYLNGSKWYVVLSATAGLTANAALFGDFSPGGIGPVGTATFDETPVVGANARFVFDLTGTTTIGGGVNDLLVINGNLNLANHPIVINPLVPLATGTYRVIDYTGTKSGSFNPTVVHNSRYTITIDDATAGQVNVIVSGGPNGDVRWNSTNSGAWDITTSNWFNLGSSLVDRFFQGDSATFNDSAAYQGSVTLAADMFPSALTIDSSTTNYSFSGAGRIGGAGNGITKNGSSLLSLNTANVFVGPFTVNGGTVRMGNPSALGTTNGGTTIASGATLDLNSFSPGTEAITVGGAGMNNTGAVINTGTALSNNGLLGPVTLTGDTAFGGINRWDVFGGSLAGGGFKLTKTGPPEIALSNLRDTALGDIEVERGQLTILGSTTMGDSTRAVTVRPGATLAHWASGTNVHDKPVVLESSRLLNNTSGGNDVATNIGAVTLTTAGTVDGASSVALMGVVGGNGTLTKNGAGTLHLGGANTYSGTTAINAGTVALAGSGTIGTNNVVIASGATLNAATRTDETLTLVNGQTLSGFGTVRGNLTAGAGTAIVPGSSAGTLTVTNGLSLTDATLTYELSGATNEGGVFNDLINVGGALSLSGTTTLKILPVGTIVTGSPYTLINYAGALSGGPLNINPISDSRLTFTVDTLTTPNKVQLLAAGVAESLEWVGGEPGAETLWDLKTTPNWLSTVPDQFFAGDTVRFNDFGVEFNVSLVGDLYPAEIRVEADENDYTFGGSGRLRGGSLIKRLAGKLTIVNTGLNDYPGPTVIEGGTIQLGTGGTAGNLGPNTITNNGTLLISRSDNLTFAQTIVGNGRLQKDGANQLTVGASLANFAGTIAATGGRLVPSVATGLGTIAGSTIINGATLEVNGLNFGAEPFTAAGTIVNSGAGQNNAFRFVTLSGDLTVGGTGRFDVRANPDATFIGNGFNLMKTGANQFSLVGVGDAGLGDINVQQGVLSVEGNTTLGLPAGTANVSSGATLTFWGVTSTHDKKIALNGGGRLFKDNGNATLIGTVSVSGSNAVDVASASGADLTLAGVISGNGLLNKIGAGNLFLTGENTHSGETRISAGNLFIGNGGTSGSVAGSIVDNATLGFRRSDATTHAGSITGSGAVNQDLNSGPVTLSGTVTIPTIRVQSGNFDKPLIFGGTAVVNAGTITVPPANSSGRLVIEPGATVSVGNFFLGDQASQTGRVTQVGGAVTVTNQLRVGHWPTETSTYLLGGGSLTLTAIPTGVVNLSGQPEQSGVVYLGIDGAGVLTQTGGVANAHGIVLDGRGNSPGTDTFTLEGGTFNLGPSGIKAGALDANPSYQIYLGGGTIGSSANWTSTLAMTLTGTNGDVAFATSTFTNTLNGVLSGNGGLSKQGVGSLRLNGVSTFLGTTRIQAGTLEGSGTLAGPLVVEGGGSLSPGTSIGTFRVNNTASLSGTTVMELNKTGAVTTSDLLSGVTTLTYGGTLSVVVTGDALADGDVFNLFDATTFAGSFSSITGLPALPSPLIWDTTQLAVDGTLRVRAPRADINQPTFSGNNLTLSGSGGLPNAGYRVLSSMDIAQPLAAWVETATGTYDGSGNFSVTFTVNPLDPQRFYVIVSP